MNLATLVAALMLLIAPHAARTRDGRAIAGAIVEAVGDYPDAPDRDVAAALLVVYARDESGLSVHPVPRSWDSKAHKVCSVWQLSCTFVEAHPSLVEQAREFLRLQRECGLSCVSPDQRHARARVVAALGLLGRVSGGVVEKQR